MREIVLTDDIVLASFIEALLKDAGIESAVFDAHASALPGAVGMMPKRLAVPSARWLEARRVLVEAGLAQWIVDDGGA